jgi:hypothetical protein
MPAFLALESAIRVRLSDIRPRRLLGRIGQIATSPVVLADFGTRGAHRRPVQPALSSGHAPAAVKG